MNLRLGLVGHGRWGRNIERTLLSFPDVSVTVIGKGEKAPARLDGVLIATQSAKHAEVALPYIRAGVATFIEKPMTTNVADAERIIEAAKRCGTIVFVGHLYLYHPAFLCALDLLPKLGTIRHVLCTGMNENSRSDCSILWDWLPHDLSMAFAIFGGAPSKVTAWSLDGGTTPKAALTKFYFGDTPVISTISWLSPVRRRQMTIVGEKATLIFDNNAERTLSFYGKSEGEPYFPGYSNEFPLTRELRVFLEAVQFGTVDTSNVELGVHIARSIAAAEQSIELGEEPVLILPATPRSSLSTLPVR
jgi:predicted dehydrogenase